MGRTPWARSAQCCAYPGGPGYRSHGFHTTYWPANLDTFVEIARARLAPATFAETYPFFQWLIVNIPSFVKISDEQLAEPLSASPGHGPKIHP